MKKIAVLSDIHGNILALEEVVNDIRLREVDLVFNLGDHVSGPLWPKETIDYLKQQDWTQILGNHDRQLISPNQQDPGPSDLYASEVLNDEDLNWLRTLPSKAEVQNGILLFHGSPEDDLLYLLETVENGRARLASCSEINERLGTEKSPLILCGHTHIPRAVEMPGGQLIINPGSVGLPAYDNEYPEPHVMENGSPHARYAIAEEKGNGWIVELIAIPYDHEKASEQARKNGQMDWEMWLQTGYVKM